ncbi:hypothetical protein [Rodentibacter caecimuris]|uniref:hypothetical protein n=1 Tax=Rodentibacter caecimuris TaxID=1796644 RepID=UPI001EFB11A1|nr:hypothetical protein [Rodentibacter heylii]
MSKQELYSIEFLDNERKPIVYCHFELYINGSLVTSLPPRADNNGKVWFNKELVKSTTMVHKVLELVFWSEKFPRTQHSTTDRFVWPEGKTSIKALMPDTYIIKTRALANENDEEQDYERAYYLVRQGDTWDSLEVKLGGDAVEALMFYNRMIYSDKLVEGTKLYYPLGFRMRNAPYQQVLKKKKESEKSEKKTEQKQASSEKENSQDNKKNSTIEQRSTANGKPVDVAISPKKYECFCHRDFTVEEVKNIVHRLRDFEPNVKRALGYSLFSAKNCNIPISEATYENFTKELNITMKKYDINTCLRKIHFLAQCYHESAHFSTSQELGSSGYLKGKPYYPYIGRGVIQLTHSGEKVGEIGYKQYFEYIGRNDYKTNYSLLNQDLHLAVDASGYFWKRGKLLSAGNFLSARYPNPSGVKVNYQKTKLSTHTTIDINLVADDDNTRQVTFLVNGGQYAIEERISYVNELKRIFNYEINHKNK